MEIGEVALFPKNRENCKSRLKSIPVLILLRARSMRTFATAQNQTFRIAFYTNNPAVAVRVG